MPLEIDPNIAALVDALLFEEERLDPLALLAAAGLLDPDASDAWHAGAAAPLLPALRASPETALRLLDAALAYGAGQGLVPTVARDGGALPFAGEHPALCRACAAVLAPPPDRHQPDLFHNSGAVLREQRVREAIVRGDAGTARQALAALAAASPRHPGLAGFDRLIALGERAARAAADPAELLAAAPVAERVLGAGARPWLAACWAQRARSLGAAAFDPARPEHHAGFAWARAGRWQEARVAIESVAAWSAQPDLLLLHAQVCNALSDVPAARRDWMRLCWHWPDRAAGFLREGATDIALRALWRDLRDLDLDLDARDLPAFMLLREPAAAGMVSPDEAPADDRGEAYRLLHRLVSGGGGIAERKALAALRPALLKLFLAGRD